MICSYIENVYGMICFHEKVMLTFSGAVSAILPSNAEESDNILTACDTWPSDDFARENARMTAKSEERQTRLWKKIIVQCGRPDRFGEEGRPDRLLFAFDFLDLIPNSRPAHNLSGDESGIFREARNFDSK